MYNDNTLLTNGKYQFVSLKRVPGDYLLELYKTYKRKGQGDPELIDYIDRNMDAIKSRTNTVPPPIQRTCTKVTFSNENDARRDLARIRSNNERLGSRKNKIPIRSYECEYCGGWHHTSREKLTLHNI